MTRNLTILQMNDSHAYLDLHQELFREGDHAVYRKAGGFARIANIVKQVRSEKEGQVLVLDGGDTIHGTFAAVKTQGEALVPILNAIQFDAMTAHWEFAYGPEQLRKVVGQLSYPLLACNVYDKSSKELVFPPYKVFETGGVKTGVVGIAATIVDKTMPSSFSKGLYFTLGNEELPGYMQKLRNEEHVDLIVVLSHLGFPQDVKLAREVKGIDVLLSSHTHNRLFEPKRVGNTIVIQSGSHGSFLGRLDLEIEDHRIQSFRHRLLEVEEGIPAEEEIQSLVDDTLAPYKDELAQVVGHTSIALNRNTMFEATMDNFLLQTLLEQTGAQMAFSNGWRYGAPIVPGPVTLNDLWNIIPVNPPLSIVDLTGKEIHTMLEENLEHTFSRDPYQQMGGYLKRMLGLNVYVKVENGPGDRIQQLFVQGQPIKADRVYQAAFVTAQGVPPIYGTNRQELEIRAIDALKDYLAGNASWEASLRGTVMAV